MAAWSGASVGHQSALTCHDTTHPQIQTSLTTPTPPSFGGGWDRLYGLKLDMGITIFRHCRK